MTQPPHDVDAFYRARDADASYAARWSAARPLGAYYRATLVRAVARSQAALRSAERVVEIGCGAGNVMRLANERGIAPPLFVGLDRAEERLRRARAEHTPGLFLCGDATELPVHSGSVDAVLSFTVMSSLPLAVRSLAAQEMVRVLRPRGIIVWYDYRHRRTGTADPPWGLTREDVQALFPRAHVDVRRAVAPVRVAEACLRAWLSPRLVELVPFLTSHLSGVIRV